MRIRLIDIIRRTDIVKKFWELDHYQTNSTELILSAQREKIIKLLLYLKNNNALYSRYLEYPKEEIKNNPEEILKLLPYSDKEFLKKNFNDNINGVNKRKSQIKYTGGSTGTPFKYHLDSESISYSWAFTYLSFHNHGNYNLGDRFITIAGNSLHSTKKKILEGIYYFIQNCYFISADIISKEISINFNRLNKSKLIYGYPSSINLLLEYFPNFVNNLPNLRCVFTTSELLLPSVRSNIQNKLGVEVFDLYGANDGSIISTECKYHNGYHYNMLNCYAESKVNLYGESELILTSLNNYSFPFVNYKVGDLGIIEKDPCTCGSPFHRIQNLKGRTRDLIYIKDGGVIHGSAFNSVFYNYPNVYLYKIVQQKDYSIDVYILLQEQKEFELTSQNLKNDFAKHFPSLIFRFNKLNSYAGSSNKFKIIETHVC